MTSSNLADGVSKAPKPFKSMNNTGFKINGISLEGPAILMYGQLFMWDVPQFGVGGPKMDVEPLEPG